MSRSNQSDRKRFLNSLVVPPLFELYIYRAEAAPFSKNFVYKGVFAPDYISAQKFIRDFEEDQKLDFRFTCFAVIPFVDLVCYNQKITQCVIDL